MAIKVRMPTEEPLVDLEVPVETGPPVVRMTVQPDPPSKVKIKSLQQARVVLPLKIRKTLEGNIFVYDHPLIDIAIMVGTNKILTLPKDNSNKDTYVTQKDFFDFLKTNGLLTLAPFQGGHIYGSMEAAYPDNEEVDSISSILVGIYKFIKGDIETMNHLKYEKSIEDWMTDPEDEDSTELGEVPHAAKKGAIDSKRRPYGLIYRI